MTAGAGQRPCLRCGTGFTWTTASPRKRFCSQQCRLAWHGDQRRGKPRPRRGTRRTQLPAPPGEHHAATPGEPPADTVLAATPACPHCRQPVAIVAGLVPPAAHATTPPRHAADTLRHAATVSDNQ